MLYTFIANHHVYTVDSKYVWIRREQMLRDEKTEALRIFNLLALLGRLGPLDTQDKMVITKSVEGGNRLGRIFFPIVVHKGKALALAGHVLGKENPGNVSPM